jgi:tetratricopeptide (TPR) repeat protein
MLVLLPACLLASCGDEPQPIAGRTDAPLQPTSAATPGPTNTPGPTREFKPGDPTATPLGEDITDPNYIKGKAAYEAEDFWRVIELMELVLENNPDLAPPHWYIGMSYFQTGDVYAALEEMERALAINPNYALAYADRALCYVTMGDQARAMEDWEKALSLDPSLAKVHHNMGVTFMRQHQYDRAVEELGLAVAIDPNRASAWGSRGEAYLMLGEYDLALADLDMALSLEEDAILYVRRGDAYRGLGQYKEAEKDYLRGKDLAPETKNPPGVLADVYVGLTEVYLGLEKYQDAVDAVNEIIDWPFDLRRELYLWSRRGRAYYGLGEYEKCIEDLTYVLDTYPDVWDFYFRGVCYHLTDQNEEAIKDLTTFLNHANARGWKDPEVQDAEERLQELED